MAGALAKSRGLCNIFKIIKEPNSVHILSAHIGIESLIVKLPAFFRSMEMRDASRINTRVLTSSKFSKRYLLVLSIISGVMNIPIYMRNILENADIQPKQQLIMIGPDIEIMFVHYMARYVREMTANYRKTQAWIKPEGMHPGEWALRAEEKFTGKFIYELNQARNIWRDNYPEEALKIKMKGCNEYLLKNLNFENQSIERFKKEGRFKPKHLL
jgi:hypothetical protein